MPSEKIVFVTGNKNKLAEVNAILGADKLDNVSLDLEEVQGTVEEVSTHKAKSAAEKVGYHAWKQNKSVINRILN